MRQEREIGVSLLLPQGVCRAFPRSEHSVCGVETALMPAAVSYTAVLQSLKREK